VRRPSTKQQGYGGGWDALSRRLRAAHVARYGWTCPGHDVPAHPSTDLVVDHLDERTDPTAPRSRALDRLRVLCRGCNSRRQAQYNAAHGIGGRRRTIPRANRKNATREWGVLATDAPSF